MKPILLNQSRKSSKIYIMLKYHLSGFFCGYSEMGKFCNFFIGGGGWIFVKCGLGYLLLVNIYFGLIILCPDDGRKNCQKKAPREKNLLFTQLITCTSVEHT